MSKNLALSFKGSKFIKSEITLTGSKSECNRALIISALSNGTVKLDNLSSAADTVTLNKLIKELQHSTSPQTVDVGPAGTAMRFLTAFLTAQKGQFLLTGTERMKQRPIGILVDALKTLGANIQYTDKQGFPPLQISGPFQQLTPSVAIKGDVSSQYLSALLMLAPTLEKGLTLEILGELTSKPYVDMTLAMLRQTGIDHQWHDSTISIKPQEFRDTTLYVEPDWSAASYWFAIAALADDAEIFLPGLRDTSLQGDRAIVQIMQAFGVHSTFENKGILIRKIKQEFIPQHFDLKDCPDLAQTVIVVSAALGIECSFSGLETLKIKETDRILALQTELGKFGVKLIENNQVYTLSCSDLKFNDNVLIKTYEDHRMAMAFAPLALKVSRLEIEEKQVVEKSYPYFWKDLAKAGFTTTDL